MPAPIAPAPLPGDVSSEALLRTLLAISPGGIALLRPLYAEAGEADSLVDFTLAYLNPAAQQLLGGLPECPAESFLTLFPAARGTDGFAFYCRAFRSGQVERHQQLYQADGFDGYYQMVAQRQGPLLVVSFTDTNEQPRSVVEEALRESQTLERTALAEAERQRALLYQVFEQAPAMICILQGPEHVFEFANPPYRALMGERPLVGRPFAEAVPELVGQGILEPLNEVYRTGEPFYASEQLARLDHTNSNPPELEKRYYNLIWQARRNLAGAVDGVLVFAFDVTPQVEARQQVLALNEDLAAINEEYLVANAALDQTQQQLRQLNGDLEAARAAAEHDRTQLQALLTQAPVAIGLFTGDELRVSAINPLMADLLGYVPAQLLGHPLFAQAPELQDQGFDELMHQVQATRVPYVGREVAATVQRQGKLLPVYFNFVYQPLYDAEERVIGVINVAVDVTEQVVARQQLEQLNRELEARVQARTHELKEQQQLLSHILGQVPAAIATLSGAEHRFTFFNEFYQRLNNQRTVLGATLAAVVPEATTQGFVALLDEVYRTGEPYVGSEVPVWLEQHLGQAAPSYYVDFRYQPLLEETGQVRGILIFAVDVSERARARQQVQVLNEELAAINEELRATNEELFSSNHQLTRTNVDLDTFIYTASHDLKAPITNIEGLLDALRYELPAVVQQEASISQLLGLMQGSVERFRTTINQLTDISRLQNEQQQPAEHVGLAQVVAGVQLDLEPLLASTKGTVTVDIDPDLTVLFSPKNLRSVVYNLLSNALKYHRPGQPPLVQVRALATASQVVLTIADNGLGLNAHQQQRLFGLFQRLHTHVEGSGVGLYMIKRLIENAGGSIQVQSTVNVGSTFQVTFSASSAA